MRGRHHLIPLQIERQVVDMCGEDTYPVLAKTLKCGGEGAILGADRTPEVRGGRSRQVVL